MPWPVGVRDAICPYLKSESSFSKCRGIRADSSKPARMSPATNQRIASAANGGPAGVRIAWGSTRVGLGRNLINLISSPQLFVKSRNLSRERSGWQAPTSAVFFLLFGPDCHTSTFSSEGAI